MTSDLALFAPPSGATVACALRAHGSVRLTADAIARLRRNPGAAPGGPLPPAVLKNADEQTVAALAAVLQAIERGHLSRAGFTDWGVLAAPRFLGRQALAVAIARFMAEGAWGVSPHLIPHHSVHAVSGTISQALGVHGPNLGIGGGPESASEAMAAAAALIAAGELPGLWVVLTGCDPEPRLNGAGLPAAEGPACPSVWNAVALATVPLDRRATGPRLHVHAPSEMAPRGFGTFGLEALQDALAAGGGRLSWRLASGGSVEIRGFRDRLES